MFYSRPYTGADDLEKMQNMLAETIRINGDCGLMHVGDIPHRIYNGRHRQPDKDPSTYVRLWEDDNKNIIGFSIFYPYDSFFDMVVGANYRGTELEAEILTVTEKSTWGLMQKYGYEATTISMDVIDCDASRMQLAEAFGYKNEKPFLAIAERPLDIEIPEPQLPDGFSIRSAEGMHEALALGQVHEGAFGRKWTEEEYRSVMESPGYRVENELVVVSPGGQFASFTINWFDNLNKTALFEPVGTHKDYHRQGLGRALMYFALRRMKAMGIERAFVAHEFDNDASTGLYAAVGFERKHVVYDYRKPMI